MDILDYARPRQHETGLDGPDLIEDIMGKPRKEQPEAESIFANNPFIEGLFEWMDSPEGQQSIAVRDVLWDLLEGVQVDAKQRQLIWPGAKRTARKERLDLDQSVQRIQKMCLEFPGGEIEEFLLDWIDMGYDPENYSQAQLEKMRLSAGRQSAKNSAESAGFLTLWPTKKRTDSPPKACRYRAATAPLSCRFGD
jgi:hypothetical protein